VVGGAAVTEEIVPGLKLHRSVDVCHRDTAVSRLLVNATSHVSIVYHTQQQTV